MKNTIFLTRTAFDALLPFSSRAAQASYQRAIRSWTILGVTIKFASDGDAKAFDSTCGHHALGGKR